ncbi:MULTISPECIES: hypothetical protein [Mannheimia]|uniref:hypothetical protein n=1 Tax=Mannheimia TaxID=75984 RepID=UPI001EE28019|nr:MULTISPECIES: hypothetical protein [Mannheimia]
MTNQQEQFNNGIFKCWQAANILEAMMKSRLQDMDGVAISVALEGVHSILIGALSEMEGLDFNQQAFTPHTATKINRIEKQRLATGGKYD